MSDINDQYPHDDPDVIEQAGFVSATIDIQNPAATAPVDIATADRGRDHAAGAASNDAAPPSSGSRDLAAMLMFDLDREAER